MLTSNEMEEKISKVSEEERFNLKNRYRLQRSRLDFVDKKRLAVDQMKLKDVLKNQPTFRGRFQKEIGTYEETQKNPQLQHAILSIVNDLAWGDMRALINDVGIHHETLQYDNAATLTKAREDMTWYQSDLTNFNYLMNALFTPLDMTDYEDAFVSFAETGVSLPISNP